MKTDGEGVEGHLADRSEQRHSIARRLSILASSHRLASALTLLIMLSGFSLYLVKMGDSAHAQRRRGRRPVARRTSPISNINYSKFSHATEKHKAPCVTCHKIPTNNWSKVRDFPDVADYPNHDACVSCHRPQFFKGSKPAICSVCHSKVSPRDDARFSFRNPASARQFTIEFPHDKHQDVIAQMFYESPDNESRFSRVSFISFQEDKRKRYNNCEICHDSRKTPTANSAVWPDSFVPDDATFKASPTTHASCFTCHWKSQQPINSDCAGCHRLAGEPLPSAHLPQRISLKFRHAREQHLAECTVCHINITKATTLRGLKPDVPITSCTECHNKDGLRQDVSGELTALDKNRDFVCVYCHTSEVGRRDPPASHYLIAERPPLKRNELK